MDIWTAWQIPAMPELLLELLSEEIPARMQDRARNDLARLVTDGLKEVGLTCSDVSTFSTPRRVGLVVDGLPKQQADIRQERKGPRVGSPDKAIRGFLRSVDFERLDQCEVREIKGAEFYFALVEKKGAPTAEALTDIVTAAIWSLGWPKSMRWGGTHFSWVRPLQNILCVFDGSPVSGNLELGGETILAFNSRTIGHRFLAPHEILVKSSEDYRQSLEKAFVLVDPERRKQRIVDEAARLAQQEGLVLRDDSELLAEVTGLVEWPVPVMGAIDDAFMELPQEVLITSMRSHQKYFALEDGDGRMASRFITIANIETQDAGKAVAFGNERVLRARLADAKFFWDQDRTAPLASRVSALRAITFHAQLGSVCEKVQRIESLVADLAVMVGANTELASRAARLAKADLTTGMVGEFPELQGLMGRYYALNDGEAAAVAEAVAGHHAPQGPSDGCPADPVTIAVALADKIDTLAGFWLIRETPTGSRDPFGLRRTALGVIRLILENGLRLPLVGLLQQAAEQVSLSAFESHTVQQQAVLGDVGVDDISIAGAAKTETGTHPRFGAIFDSTCLVFQFIVDRLKVHFRHQGMRHDLVAAVFDKGDDDDLVRLLARVESLDRLLQSEDGENLLIGYRRAANILRIEEKKDGRPYTGTPEAGLLQLDQELALYAALQEADKTVAHHLEAEAFADAMAALARLRGPIDRFFDSVKANDNNAALRENRLFLLSKIRTVMGQAADFSLIEG